MRLSGESMCRIDTWVNVAAVSVYARFEETSPEEFRRVIEVNYLGQVHGSLAALPHLRQTGQGALIAISSVESIVSLPLHSSYSASKHAVEGAMDALRRELMAEGGPISVTSIKPGTINTILQQFIEQDGCQAKGPASHLRPRHSGGLRPLCGRESGARLVCWWCWEDDGGGP